MAATGTLNNPRLSGLPMIYTVHTSRFADVTFQRVVAVVSVTDTLGTVIDSFRFSQPTRGDEDIRMDISSAVRAMADNHRYEPQTLSYPAYQIAIELYEEYLLDGIVHKVAGQGIAQSGRIYIGTLSDMERLTESLPATWSRKPDASAQLAWTGARMAVAGRAVDDDGVTWNNPTAFERTVPSGSSPTYNTFGTPKPRDGYQLRFINSLGVHEDAFLQCLRTTEVPIKTDAHTVALQETVTDFSRRIAVKKNGHEKWKMSSGPVDQAWQQWYLHEVLMASWAWLFVNGRWIPCGILPEETVTGMDRQKASQLEVQFTIEFDINGSPF